MDSNRKENKNSAYGRSMTGRSAWLAEIVDYLGLKKNFIDKLDSWKNRKVAQWEDNDFITNLIYSVCSGPL